MPLGSSSFARLPGLVISNGEKGRGLANAAEKNNGRVESTIENQQQFDLDADQHQITNPHRYAG